MQINEFLIKNDNVPGQQLKHIDHKAKQSQESMFVVKTKILASINRIIS